MFYGDDDLMPKDTILSVMNHLRSFQDYPIHIFNRNNKNDIQETGLIDFKKGVTSHLYHMGNACTIANTKKSQELINKYYQSIIKSCWPQTHLYLLLSYYSSNVRPIVLSTINIFEEQEKDFNNIPNSFYLIDSAIISFLKLGIEINSFKNIQIPKRYFLRGVLFKNFFVGFILKKVLLHYKFTDSRKQRKEFLSHVILNMFKSTPKWFFISLIIIISTFLNRFVYLELYTIFKTLSNSKSIRKFHQNYSLNKKEFLEYKNSIIEARENKHSLEINKGDW